MKPERVKGTRDFSPQQVNRRNYIFDSLKDIFVRFGFQPIETPSMERLSTLMGKYGEEGDQLLYKILSNGDYLSKAKEEDLNSRDYKKLLSTISKRGLRYDLTVPFARYAVMHRNEINLPFKRYQIQPVWRGDRPQKGRYCEFYQCDVDVIGSDSLIYEAELAQIYDQAFAKFGINAIIRFNNRKILDGLAHYCGKADKFVSIVTAIDKLDKIGWDAVKEELARNEIDEEAYAKIRAVVEAPGLEELKTMFAEIPVGMKGIEEIETVLGFLKGYTFENTFKIDFSLARGLSYYTGGIYEVIVDTEADGQEKVKMGSIGGGGRYDDLAGSFGWKGISGVGVSFGAERIYDVLEELNLFDETGFETTKLLFMGLGSSELNYAFTALQAVRAAGINAEIFPDAIKPNKLRKKLNYPNARGIPYVVIVGAHEMESGQLVLKNMATGDQETLNLTQIIEKIS